MHVWSAAWCNSPAEIFWCPFLRIMSEYAASQAAKALPAFVIVSGVQWGGSPSACLCCTRFLLKNFSGASDWLGSIQDKDDLSPSSAPSHPRRKGMATQCSTAPPSDSVPHRRSFVLTAAVRSPRFADGSLINAPCKRRQMFALAAAMAKDAARRLRDLAPTLYQQLA